MSIDRERERKRERERERERKRERERVRERERESDRDIIFFQSIGVLHFEKCYIIVIRYVPVIELCISPIVSSSSITNKEINQLINLKKL